jgi:ribonuclease D
MFGDTELRFVDTAEGLRAAAAELASARVIGVDTESDSFHHYQEKVCLLQFSDLHRDYIVDPLAVPDLSPLAPILADRRVVKIFHGADYDVVCMKRDFGVEIHNIFDTMIGAQMAGFARFGLADLIETFFGHHIDKQYQRHDWAKRPLLDEHIQYARGDTHFLLAIREILIRRLRVLGRLDHLREECRLLEKREWAPREPDPAQWTKTRGSSGLDPDGMRVLRAVWRLRDAEARSSDRPAFKVLPDDVLVRVAERRPQTLDQLEAVFPGKAAMKKRYGRGLVEAVVSGLADTTPLETTERPKPKKKKGSPATRLKGKDAERALAALKEWRNRLTGSDPLFTPITTASNSVLKEVARARPLNLEELAAIPEVRRWQVAEYGPQLLAVLDASVPWPPVDAPEGEEPAPSKRRRRRKR